ncbi:MAG TPA: 2Fe-2S iron-sulfur cluster-binding protein [Phycisphaerae bacterium]|nr:2Fe-2S iron-sulfur cluster-binding protein [Phycisphaerae bacterium]
MTITMDGRQVRARAGQTVLEAALANGVDIPHVCYHAEIGPIGSCRLCIVEIEGVNGLPTSCTTPVADGMVVRTETEQINKLRRALLELLLLNHPTACLVCDKQELCLKYRYSPTKAGRTTGCNFCTNKDICDIRKLAERLGLTELTFPPSYQGRPLERSEPFIDRDYNLCVLCGRCVRTCRDVHGTAAVEFVDRGGRTRIAGPSDLPHADLQCRFCGACIDTCSTGALSDRYAKWRGAPERTEQTYCAFCPIGCPIAVRLRGDRAIGTGSVPGEDPTSRPLCALGRFAVAEFAAGTSRLAHPRMKRDGLWRRASWDDAVRAAAARLSQYKGSQTAVVVDASSSLEAQYLLCALAEHGLDGARFFVAPHNARPETALPALAEQIRNGRIKAAYTATAAVEPTVLDNLDLLIVQDCYPSPVSEAADILLPTTVFIEAGGTFVDRDGVVKKRQAVAPPPGEARPEWKIAADLARALGEDNLAYESLEQVSAAVETTVSIRSVDEPAEQTDPAHDLSALPKYFRGHRIGRYVKGLAQLEELITRQSGSADVSGD